MGAMYQSDPMTLTSRQKADLEAVARGVAAGYIPGDEVPALIRRIAFNP